MSALTSRSILSLNASHSIKPRSQRTYEFFSDSTCQFWLSFLCRWNLIERVHLFAHTKISMILTSDRINFFSLRLACGLLPPVCSAINLNVLSRDAAMVCGLFQASQRGICGALSAAKGFGGFLSPAFFAGISLKAGTNRSPFLQLSLRPNEYSYGLLLCALVTRS
jgi:hypothetical protein